LQSKPEYHDRFASIGHGAQRLTEMEAQPPEQLKRISRFGRKGDGANAVDYRG
jgi:hypothetical protein